MLPSDKRVLVVIEKERSYNIFLCINILEHNTATFEEFVKSYFSFEITFTVILLIFSLLENLVKFEIFGILFDVIISGFFIWVYGKAINDSTDKCNNYTEINQKLTLATCLALFLNIFRFIFGIFATIGMFLFSLKATFVRSFFGSIGFSRKELKEISNPILDWILFTLVALASVFSLGQLLMLYRFENFKPIVSKRENEILDQDELV